MGYRLWNPESHKVIRSSHVIFNESKMHKKPIKEIEFRKVTFEDIPTETQKTIIIPSVKMTTLRIVLGLVTIEDMELVQMDVKIAFLHGDLEEDVYMAQPKGYEQPGREQLVCKLNKALYGLKQGSRQWYQKFDTFMRSQEFKRSQEDYCLYTKKLSDGSQIILILYVDDMLIAGKSKLEIANLKQILSSQFAMKDLGEANHFLGMHIKRKRKKSILELS